MSSMFWEGICHCFPNVWITISDNSGFVIFPGGEHRSVRAGSFPERFRSVLAFIPDRFLLFRGARR